MLGQNAPAQLPVWLISSCSKLKTNAVPRIRISRDDNSVIIFKYIINCGRLCPFTDTSLCRLGRYRLQIWEEPLRFFNYLFIIVKSYTYIISVQLFARAVRFSLIRALAPEPKKTAHRAPAYPTSFFHGLLARTRTTPWLVLL